MPLTLREETPADYAGIYDVVARAFGRPDESRVIDRLRETGYARLSLVAEDAGQLVGHVFYSELPIVCESGTVLALALAPLAVVPERQNEGIGTQLVREAHERLRAAGHRIVIVLGHAHYYPRFGFSVELARQLTSPFAGDHFMALELVPDALTGVHGRVEYPPPFGEF